MKIKNKINIYHSSFKMKSKNLLKFYLFFLLKILVYSLPLKYSFRKIFFGRNGLMDDLNYCKSIFNQHVLKIKKNSSVKNILEIGPGDSCYSALLALRNDFKNITLIDKDSDQLLSTLKNLKEMGIKIKKINSYGNLNVFSFNEKKKSIKVYILKEDFKNIPSIKLPSNDIIFSNAVLQHLDKNQLINLLEFCEKVSSNKTIHSHQIRFTDHITGANQYFDHYKVPKIIWESKLLKKFPFWTNRFNFNKFSKIFNSFGLKELKTKKFKLNDIFVNYHFVLKK